MKSRILIHADEACLGNGAARATPGGAGGLVEITKPDGVARRDFYVAEPDTTNNRMAIRSAILALELLGTGGRRLALDFVSDSEYLVKGMNEWMRGWKRRDWRNVKNPELWQELDELAQDHDVEWHWVRGHNEHPKNEYADHLATTAARDQVSSDGLVESGFLPWLATQQEKGKFVAVDPDSLTL